MTVTLQKMTLVEYLDSTEDSDVFYELVNGELVEMPTESELNRRIASFLFAYFLQLGIPAYRLTMKTEIVVTGSRATVRLPDLMVLSEELATALEGARRSMVILDMPSPLLTVEVVSPNQEKRDYRYKRSEYAARGIAEYWIVDPMRQAVTVLEWVDGMYEEQVFEQTDKIISPLFGALDLTVKKVLEGR